MLAGVGEGSLKGVAVRREKCALNRVRIESWIDLLDVLTVTFPVTFPVTFHDGRIGRWARRATDKHVSGGFTLCQKRRNCP